MARLAALKQRCRRDARSRITTSGGIFWREVVVATAAYSGWLRQALMTTTAVTFWLQWVAMAASNLRLQEAAVTTASSVWLQEMVMATAAKSSWLAVGSSNFNGWWYLLGAWSTNGNCCRQFQGARSNSGNCFWNLLVIADATMQGWETVFSVFSVLKIFLKCLKKNFS